MGVWHRKSSRTQTGARVRKHRGKRKHQLGRVATETVMGEPKRREIDSKGRTKKKPIMQAKYVNVTDPDKNETYRAEIEDVEKNPANMDYQRRKVITKGTIIKTSKGKARVTSRPGQDGILNAILI
ncbi:30S ribosomal protein S8e [Candidatus Thorarchaeota archaeon]|nr:MAG: 30S ribosomal protein S8e [Candidatus Thorarchaeota archaeon]